jgi:hypothetical protein
MSKKERGMGGLLLTWMLSFIIVRCHVTDGSMALVSHVKEEGEGGHAGSPRPCSSFVVYRGRPSVVRCHVAVGNVAPASCVRKGAREGR